MYLGLEYTHASRAYVFLYTQPFFTALLAWMILREPVRRATWFAMIAAMVGFDRPCSVHHKDIWDHTKQVTQSGCHIRHLHRVHQREW